MVFARRAVFFFVWWPWFPARSLLPCLKQPPEAAEPGQTFSLSKLPNLPRALRSGRREPDCRVTNGNFVLGSRHQKTRSHHASLKSQLSTTTTVFLLIITEGKEYGSSSMAAGTVVEPTVKMLWTRASHDGRGDQKFRTGWRPDGC